MSQAESQESKENNEKQKESRIHLRGFASLSLERRRELASRGGKKAHEMGNAYKLTPEKAIEVGNKGRQRQAELRAEEKRDAEERAERRKKNFPNLFT